MSEATKETVNRFIDALHTLEREGNLEPLIELFADDAELTSLTEREPLRGKPGAREFWNGYRSAFQEVHSEFDRIIEGDNIAVLEWHSEGTLPNGHPISYRGASIIEPEEGRIYRFRTYYDSAVFFCAEREHSPETSAEAAES